MTFTKQRRRKRNSGKIWGRKKSMAQNKGHFKNIHEMMAKGIIQGSFPQPVKPRQPGNKNGPHKGLPGNLKRGIENLSRCHMDDVKVHHNSEKPAQIDALAFTRGADIHIAPGQEKHLPHEAWHVVQQKQGRVRPTIQMVNGLKVNDDPGLEKEADVMGRKAAINNLSRKMTNNWSGKTEHKNNLLRKTTYSNAPVQMLASTDLTEKNIVKRGSPATYKIDDKYIKKWTSKGEKRSQKMVNHWDAASAEDVRTPRYKREKLTDENDYVFWSKECKGTEFFQHSKSGKPALLRAWLDKNHGNGYLKRLSAMFRKAKMGDPQGYFESQANGAFEFIDIQKMNDPGQMGGYADYIDSKLNKED